jgi:pimeloyl-ACP methyl ester carboxylesterase
MVHGYNHDPNDPDFTASRAGGEFDIWPRMLVRQGCDPLHWYSGRQGLRGRLRALSAGYFRNTYAFSYEILAVRAARHLAEHAFHIVTTRRGKPYVICHSLGSRVVLLAMKQYPNLFSKVLFLNGAESSDVAEPIIGLNDKTKILNICVKTDDVLSVMGAVFEPRFGYHPCMGQHGLKECGKNVKQLFLDDPQTQKNIFEANGWTIAGDNPKSIGDHFYSYTFEGNWPLYQRFFDT